jgi:hypothetical protein
MPCRNRVAEAVRMNDSHYVVAEIESLVILYDVLSKYAEQLNKRFTVFGT